MAPSLVDHFAQMARNNRWANHCLLHAVGELKPGEFEAERTSFFPSIGQTLNHILVIDLYYIDALEEGGRGLSVFDAFGEIKDASVLTQEQAATDQRLIRFCESLSADDLDREVITDRGEDGQVPERIADLLAHLFQHQIHHRGQVHAMLAGTSVRPPQLDDFFLRFDRADTIDAALAEGRT